MTALQLITEALQELGVIGQGEVLSAADADLALNKLSRLIDNWNADREAIYADQFLSFTLTPGLQPHTIGPTGATWTVSQRPVSIENASLVVGTLNYPLNLRLADWWANLLDPTLATTIPTDLYYDATWPNGSIYLWPVPMAANGLQVQVRSLLSTYTLSTVVTLPPGYRDALTLTLAEDCITPFARQTPPLLLQKAAMARARIFTNNLITPPLVTRDVGLPGHRSWFDWRSGLVR